MDPNGVGATAIIPWPHPILTLIASGFVSENALQILQLCLYSKTLVTR